MSLTAREALEQVVDHEAWAEYRDSRRRDRGEANQGPSPGSGSVLGEVRTDAEAQALADSPIFDGDPEWEEVERYETSLPPLE